MITNSRVLYIRSIVMARYARGSSSRGGRTITRPISAGSRVKTGGKFDRAADPGDSGLVNSNRESGPRLNPKKSG